MRTFVILAGPLIGAALFTGTPAQAELGCVCVKIGLPTACTSGISACTVKGGGVCVLPCSYQPPKMASKHVKRAAKKKN